MLKVTEASQQALEELIGLEEMLKLVDKFIDGLGDLAGEKLSLSQVREQLTGLLLPVRAEVMTVIKVFTV